MAPIIQTTFWNAFSAMKMYEFLIKISLKFVPRCPINNIPSLGEIMAWRRPGDKPLSDPLMVSVLTHICVTRPQGVNAQRIMVEQVWNNLPDGCNKQGNIDIHYNDVIMGAIESQITSITIVYSFVYSDAYQRKHQSPASLAFVWGNHRGLLNSQHKWSVTRKMFPFDDVIMVVIYTHWEETHVIDDNNLQELLQSFNDLLIPLLLKQHKKPEEKWPPCHNLSSHPCARRGHGHCIHSILLKWCQHGISSLHLDVERSIDSIWTTCFFFFNLEITVLRLLIGHHWLLARVKTTPGNCDDTEYLM